MKNFLVIFTITLFSLLIYNLVDTAEALTLSIEGEPRPMIGRTYEYIITIEGKFLDPTKPVKLVTKAGVQSWTDYIREGDPPKSLHLGVKEPFFFPGKKYVLQASIGTQIATMEFTPISFEESTQSITDIDQKKQLVNRYIVWDTECTEQGNFVIKNVKEEPFGFTPENIESYYYEILDTKFELIGKGYQKGDLIINPKQLPNAKIIKLYSSQMLAKEQIITSCGSSLKLFSIDSQCPTLENFEIIYDSNQQKYDLDPHQDLQYQLEITVPSTLPSDLKIIVDYSDGSVREIFPTSSTVDIPFKNGDSKINNIIVLSENYESYKIPIYCGSAYFSQEQLKSEKEFREQMGLNLARFEKATAEAENYCNYLTYGCKVTYNIRQQLNVPNDFIKKMWTEDELFSNVNKIDYSFSRIDENSFSYEKIDHTKNNQQIKYSDIGYFEIGGLFIHGNVDIGIWEGEKSTLNIAGYNRDVYHFWSEYDSGITLAGDVEMREDFYYDWDSGLLLKYERNRTLLDVSGQTNNEKFVEEISSVNFPKKESGSGGGCLIATATYGSELAPQVQQLRELRDNKLLQTQSGSAFMESFNDFYYSFSPIIADYERENPYFKEAVKIAITPMISSLSILNNVEMDSEESVLGYGISLILLNVGMYVGVPAIVVLVGIKKKF